MNPSPRCNHHIEERLVVVRSNERLSPDLEHRTEQGLQFGLREAVPESQHDAFQRVVGRRFGQQRRAKVRFDTREDLADEGLLRSEMMHQHPGAGADLRRQGSKRQTCYAVA